VLALRLLAGATTGPLGTLFGLAACHHRRELVLRADAQRDARLSHPRLRVGELRGQRAVAGSVEYRMPLALVGRALGHLPSASTSSGSTCSPTPVTPGARTSPRLTRLRSAGPSWPA